MDDYSLGQSDKTEADDRLDQMLAAARVELVHTLARQQRAGSATKTEADTPARPKNAIAHHGTLGSITVAGTIGGPLGVALEALEDAQRDLAQLVPMFYGDEVVTGWANVCSANLRQAASALAARNMSRPEFERTISDMQRYVSTLLRTRCDTEELRTLVQQLREDLAAARRAVVLLFDPSSDPTSSHLPF
ncbi:hypothetical protein GCM10022403_084240 [Streptomyces coacervatus]|uniref:Uncharacterized protein n=1 Tax=Streptomyces coacervatus TaxID=647381 RepID=A0ABP7JAY9_9ACTN|nr:hypothetical protein [Streptomyces coacervatus]MDF2273360.1 hypothetical protein [Streptomyces coacervatus]